MRQTASSTKKAEGTRKAEPSSDATVHHNSEDHVVRETPILDEKKQLIQEKTVVPEPIEVHPPPPPVPSPQREIRSIKIKNRVYQLHPSVVLDGRNTVVEAIEDITSKPVMIKIYATTVVTATNEVHKLREIMRQPKSTQFTVKLIDFADDVQFNNTICSVLVMKRGHKNLRQMVERYDSKTNMDNVVNTMKQIAECLHFLHNEMQLVHGDVKLENVVNFGDDFPKMKLIDFENCCHLNQPMQMECSPEYCPPELAVQVVGNAVNKSSSQHFTGCVKASPSFDVWCFGVLWLKYLVRGRVLVEFMNLSPLEILTRIAQEGFGFEETLKQLEAAKPMKDLIRQCLNREATRRPACHEILKNYVLRGATTTLVTMSLIGQRQQEMESHLTNMLHQQRQMIWQLEKLDLPCLWVLVPWKDDPTVNKSKTWSWSSLMGEKSNDLELRLLCDAVFDDKDVHSNEPCYACPEQHRIRVRRGPKFLHKSLPILRCAAVLLKIVSVASLVVGVPGLGLVSNLVSNTFGGIDLLGWTKEVLAQACDDDDGLGKVQIFIDDIVRLVESKQFDDEQAVVAQLHANSKAIRSLFETAEKQQLMRNLLQAIDKDQPWTQLKLVGGLQKVCDSSGNVRWVCSTHAQKLGVSTAQLASSR